MPSKSLQFPDKPRVNQVCEIRRLGLHTLVSDLNVFLTKAAIFIMATPTAPQKPQFAQTSPVNKFLFSSLDRFTTTVESLVLEVAVRV